ncbi:hypothetical protein [Streptomyces sp. 7N604]|uniref:hypothetical protein n=1 Tax=Streptomyces sp. 7N604 TaxID=3457415 RepID=UPI003FD5C4A7
MLAVTMKETTRLGESHDGRRRGGCAFIGSIACIACIACIGFIGSIRNGHQCGRRCG